MRNLRVVPYFLIALAVASFLLLWQQTPPIVVAWNVFDVALNGHGRSFLPIHLTTSEIIKTSAMKARPSTMNPRIWATSDSNV